MTLEAEVRLIRWAESSTAGRTITIELPPGDGEVHPFRGFPTGHAHGQRFKMAFVPIDDSETEIPDPVADVKLRSPDSPPQSRPILATRPHGPAEGVSSRSIMARQRYAALGTPQKAVVRACQLPKEPRFREWAACLNEEQAVAFVRGVIGGSRALIAEDPKVCQRFDMMYTQYMMDTGQMAAPR